VEIPDITRSVDWVFIHCDLISRVSNNIPSDVIYAFSTSDLQVSYSFEIKEQLLEWHPVNKKNIESVSIRVTDGKGGILDLNGIDIMLKLIIEKE